MKIRIHKGKSIFKYQKGDNPNIAIHLLPTVSIHLRHKKIFGLQFNFIIWFLNIQIRK